MFKKIYKEIQSAWKSTPGLIKHVLVFAIVLNATSLASIADNIAQWKGFFKTGIEWYRILVRPALSFFEKNFLFLSSSGELIF